MTDPREFEKIIRAHEAFASGRPGGWRAIPRGIKARGMSCNQRLLRDVDFTGADLSGSSFIGTDLTRAALYCANLANCDFRSAQLVRADIRGARLAGARLAGANLDGADMRAAVLCQSDALMGLRWIGSSAKLGGASMNGADMSDAFALGVDFTDCSLKGAKLRSANLKNANFTNANLEGVDLKGARLVGVRLHGAILTGVDLTGFRIPPEALKGCVVDPTEDAWARLIDIRAQLEAMTRWVASSGEDGAPAVLDGYDLRPLGDSLAGSLLAGVSARKAVAVGLNFRNAQLQGANFEGADLRGANFTNTDLRGANFQDANLAHAIVRDANLGALQLQHGRRRPANFAGATLIGTGITLSATPADPAAVPALSA